MEMTVKELEIQGCRTFVCPNLSLIDEKGKELQLKDATIKRAKDMAIRYFKDTYHKPHYSSAKHVLPAFVYIASILEGDRRSQSEMAEVFGTTNATIRKWYTDVIETLKMKILDEERKLSSHPDSEIGRERELSLPDMTIIDTGGKSLLLKDTTIKRAKDLAVRYFEVAKHNRYYSHIRQLFPAFIYLASLLENDRRTQMDVSTVFGVSESVISNWHRDVTNTLGMKIIYAEDRRVIAVLEKTKRH